MSFKAILVPAVGPISRAPPGEQFAEDDQSRAMIADQKSVSCVRSDGASRVAWVDLARGIGIILVVFGHVWRGLNDAGEISSQSIFTSIDAAVYIFHMPLFFFLSGLFFNHALEKKILPQLKQRLMTIIYPLFLWFYILYFAKYIAGQSINVPVDLSAGLPLPLPPSSIFWFLWALFLIQTVVAVYWLFPIGPLGRSVVGLVLALSAWYAFVAYGNGNIWIGKSIENFPYFALGLLLTIPSGQPNYRMSVAAAAIFAAILIWANSLQSSRFISVPASAICVLSLSILLRRFDAARVAYSLKSALCFLGRRSMAIYLSHILFTASARIIMMNAGVSGIVTEVAFGTVFGLLGPIILYETSFRLGIRRLVGF